MICFARPLPLSKSDMTNSKSVFALCRTLFGNVAEHFKGVEGALVGVAFISLEPLNLFE